MRLEEWQKFIESQFLEEEAEPELPPAAPEKAPEEKPAIAAEAAPVPEPKPAGTAPLENAELRALLAAPVPTPIRQAESPPITFEPMLNFDAEIPDFAAYLPASRPASSVAPKPETPAPFQTEAVVTERTEAAATPEKQAESKPVPARRAPLTRARHARNVKPENVPSGLSAAELWAQVPRYMQTLLALERMEQEETAQYSYKRPFTEGRRELIERLLDPVLSLEDTARLLNVCPTTVRRYTNRGILTHYRKEPERGAANPSPIARETRQRRFRLSDILAFLETQQTALEAD